MRARAAAEPGARVAAGLEAIGPDGATPTRGSGRIVVGFSGGIDSFCLLHLALHDAEIRAAVGAGSDPTRVVAAHLDHAMRPDSASAAASIEQWATSAGVDLRIRRLAEAPASEAAARDARYAFLEEVADEVGASMVWTAHHADDQVETVLFRILRGSGVAGLAGIPARRGRIVRPFLTADPPVRRSELETYAAAHGLPVLEDPTNEDADHAARNRLRHEVLPLLERAAPGASDRLLRLARNARRSEEERDSAVAYILDGLGVADAFAAAHPTGTAGSRQPAGGRLSLPVSAWAGVSPPLRRALLRGMAERLGVALSEAATEAALTLSPTAQSGRGLDLPGGLRLEREFDAWTLSRGASAAEAAGDLPDIVRVEGPVPGEARFLPTVDRRCRIRWAPAETSRPAADSGVAAGAAAGAGAGVAWRVAVPVAVEAFPLTVRGWREGDRMARPSGTVSLAKAWAEARVPRRDRPGRVVVVDGEGTLLAAEGLGVARSGPTVHARGPGESADGPLLVFHLEPEE